MTLTEPHTPIDRWALAPDVEHVNHGSFGGCPREVIDAAAVWRTRLEAAPMRFLVLEWQAAIDRARDTLASFLSAPAERLAFVPNATTGIAIAIASMSLSTGDEVVITDHTYRACRNQLMLLAGDRGLKLVTVPLPVPYDPDATVSTIAAALTSRTKLVLLDHITSPTALVMPIDRIATLLSARDIALIVDGAHAPGQLALDVSVLLDAGVTWYAGNNHKWVCAPKGTGFLVGSTAAALPRPVVMSHGASAEYGPANRYHALLDWMGTHDPTPHLCVPVAIETLAALGGGWPQVITRNHALAIEMRDRLAAALDATPLAPDNSLGTMASLAIALPAGTTALAVEMQLLADGWELPIVDFLHGPLVRISAHLYNHAGQADAVARKLHALGVRGR